MENDRRAQQRLRCKCLFRIYSSIKSGAYTVEVTDINNDGAFVRSKHLPTVGEIITYEIIDNTEAILMSGNAQVKWLKSKVVKESKGFGVRFMEPIDNSVIQTL